MKRRRMRSGLVAMVLCVFMMALMVAPSTAQAKQVSGTVLIEAGDYYGWRMDIMIPSTIEYNITSVNATHISVLVLDEDNYTRFTANQSFLFYENYSFVDVPSAQANMTVLAGSVYIVVDNSDRSLEANGSRGEAEVLYWVGSSFQLDAVPDQGSTAYIYVLVGVLFVVFVAVIYLTRRAVKSRKK